MIKCPICLELSKKYKTLLCFHSFCETCWNKFTKQKNKDENDLICPICRRIIKKREDKTDEKDIIQNDYYLRFSSVSNNIDSELND